MSFIRYSLIPILCGWILYWPGLTTWFQKDDFAWLGLRDMVHNSRDLAWALFTPLAQGTLRVFSERVFYLSFYDMFGLNALPYRLWAFATYSADCVLLIIVCTRLTKSRRAGFFAALLWTLNAGLSVVMSWTAVYYQLACAGVFLLAIYLLIQYDETGRRRFAIAEWVVFLLGFGVLELNVVYPALAASYALAKQKPRLLRHILPMFVFSGAYTLWHLKAAPLPVSGPYRTYWDFKIFSTLWTYVKWAMGPSRLNLIGIFPSFWRSLATTVLILALLAFLIQQLRRKQWIAAMFAAWFVIVLSPLLPLRDHMQYEYLTVPVLGLAMLAGWAMSQASQPWVRVVTVALAIVYAIVNIAIGRATVVSFHERAAGIHRMIDGVVTARHQSMGRIVIIRGASDDIFWSSIFHRPFRLYGISDVYVDAADIGLAKHNPDAMKFFLDPSEQKLALDSGAAIVYQIR